MKNCVKGIRKIPFSNENKNKNSKHLKAYLCKSCWLFDKLLSFSIQYSIHQNSKRQEKKYNIKKHKIEEKHFQSSKSLKSFTIHCKKNNINTRNERKNRNPIAENTFNALA